MGASISSEDSVPLEEVVVVSDQETDLEPDTETDLETDTETDLETYPTFVSAREMDWFWPFI